MPKKFTYSFVKEELKSFGCSLVTGYYSGVEQPLDCLCPKGHKFVITWHIFKRRGVRCKKCNSEEKNKIKYKNIKKAFENIGYRLVSSRYTGHKDKLDYVCFNGHKGRISWGDFNREVRCPECGGSKKKTVEFVKEEFNKEGYKLLSKIYVNSNGKLHFKCPRGHVGKTTWSYFNSGCRCQECADNFRKTLGFVKREFDCFGYTILSPEYINKNIKLDYKCNNGHLGSMSRGNFMGGHRCPKCGEHGISNAEKEVFSFVASICSGVIGNVKKVIPPFELDIYIPEKKLAIEYNGLYWHSEAQGKDRFYHYNKTKLCAEKGIRLITIFEDEFLAGKEEVFAKLKSVIENPNIIFPVYTKAGALSDLGWDGLTSDSLYIKEGFIFNSDIDPIEYYIESKKNRIKVKGLQVIKNTNKIWDCGYILYNRGR